MAVVQCKRGRTRDKSRDGSGTATPTATAATAPEAIAANAPAAVVGLEAAKLADQVLEHVQAREQRLWALQLDVRDLRHQLDDRRSAANSAQAQSLVVRRLLAIAVLLTSSFNLYHHKRCWWLCLASSRNLD